MVPNSRSRGVGVLLGIGHGDTRSNRNDTARTSSLARPPFDRHDIPPQIEQDREVEDDTDADDKEGKREEGRRLNSQSRF